MVGMECEPMGATSGVNCKEYEKSYWNRKRLGWGGGSLLGVVWKGCYSHTI